MILVSQDDGTVTARTQSELELSLPVLLDGPLWKLSSSLGAVSVPMIVELEGREVAGVTEGFNKAEMRLVLERLARGKRLGWKVSSALDAPELPEHKPG